MRVLVASPGSRENIDMTEIEEPVAQPHETVVRVRAVSLNRGEVNRLMTAEQGARFGWDLAGVVERSSPDGGGLPEGTRVVGWVMNTAWAELVAVPNNRLALIPDDLSFAAASSLPVAGLTALRTLRVGGLLLGRRVLITGASGGVGRFAVQLAARAGAQVVAISRSSERAEGLESLGAGEIVHTIEEAGGPFDLILESVGGSLLATALELIGLDGTVVTFGSSSKEPTTIDIRKLYGKQGARMEGFSLLAPNQPQDFRADLAFLAAEVAAGRLDPQIDYERPWEEAADALEALRERRVNGKAVLTIG